jgi:uncharacterized protein (TIGR02145 family)
MKKIITLSLMVFSMMTTFSQNKKEQIEQLTYSKDSLQYLIDKERNSSNEKIKELEEKIALKKEGIAKIQNELAQVNLILTEKEQLLNKVKQEKEIINKNLIVVVDSIKMIRLEDSIKTLNFKGVQIGKQIWMGENLNVDKFRNGDPIPEAKSVEEWIKAWKNDQPAWCYYDFNPANGKKYGKLYNFHAVTDPRDLAPEGWYIPWEREWNELTEFYGGPEAAANKIKSTSGWDNNGNNNKERGFAGLPGGILDSNGTFEEIGVYGYWWSQSSFGNDLGDIVRI